MAESAKARKLPKAAWVIPIVLLLALVVLTALFGARFYTILGNNALEGGDLVSARRAYSRSIRMSTFFGNADARVNALRKLIEVEAQLGLETSVERCRQLRALLEKTGAEDEEIAEVIGREAWLLAKSGRTEMATVCARDATKLDEECPNALHALGLVSLANENDMKAVEYFERAIYSAKQRNSGHLAEHFFARALAEIRIDNFRRAQRDLELAVESGKTDRRTWQLLVKCYIKLQELSKALNAAERAIHQDEGFSAMYFNAASVLLAQGEFAAALQMLEKPQAKKADFTEAGITYAVSCHCNGIFDKARRFYARGYPADPEFAALAYSLTLLENAEAEIDVPMEWPETARGRFFFRAVTGEYDDIAASDFIALADLKEISEERYAAQLDELGLGYLAQEEGLPVAWEELMFALGARLACIGRTAHAKELLERVARSQKYFYWCYPLSLWYSARLEQK
ncbi:MAG: hypothetical protein U5N86_08790 [Planctomycetota bacterium]|nr:hypothetical protein [Planctomycetota bacterium]